MNSGQVDGYPVQEGLIADIVSTVTEKTGSDPVTTIPPLGEVIDTDALQQLYQHPRDGVEVSFEYQGQIIDIDPGGHVTVRDDTAGD